MLDLQSIVGDFAPKQTSPRVRFGEVVSAAPLIITVGGSSTQISGVKYLNSYSPVMGDTVLLLTDGLDIVILGALA